MMSKSPPKWIRVSLVLLTYAPLSSRAGKGSVLFSHPSWGRQCHVVGCRWAGFLGKMSSMQLLTLGRRFSVQILPASSNYKNQGITVGKHEEILWFAFCSPVFEHNDVGRYYYLAGHMEADTWIMLLAFSRMCREIIFVTVCVLRQ